MCLVAHDQTPTTMPQSLYSSDGFRDKLRALVRTMTNQDLSDEEADAAVRDIKICLLWLWLHFSRTSEKVANCPQLDFSAQMKLENIIDELKEDKEQYLKTLES